MKMEKNPLLYMVKDYAVFFPRYFKENVGSLRGEGGGSLSSKTKVFRKNMLFFCFYLQFHKMMPCLIHQKYCPFQ